MERLSYEVVVEDGKLLYKESGEFLHTIKEGSRSKWIFVLSTSKILYVGKKKKGSFQHSSFLAGGATSCAGRLVVEHGVLKVSFKIYYSFSKCSTDTCLVFDICYCVCVSVLILIRYMSMLF